jgi:hypothetical protein
VKTSSHLRARNCRLSKNHKTPAHHTGNTGGSASGLAKRIPSTTKRRTEMNRTVKTLAATALIAATAISLGGAETSSAAAVALTQTVGEATTSKPSPSVLTYAPSPHPSLQEVEYLSPADYV